MEDKRKRGKREGEGKEWSTVSTPQTQGIFQGQSVVLQWSPELPEELKLSLAPPTVHVRIHFQSAYTRHYDNRLHDDP